jgi:hypothetical protein
LDKISLDTDVAQILARLDRSSSDTLLNSIAQELLRLHHSLHVVVARMHALEITQTTYDQMISSGDTPAFTSMAQTAAVDASFSLSAEAGFYPLEYDSLGVPYRWTGPESTFLFELFIDRKVPADIRMRHSKVRFAEARHPVRCYVDGHEIATTLVEVEGELEVRGLLPSRDLVGGTVISFVCPRVSSPASDGQSQDTRLLGVAFRWLRIEARPVVPAEQEEIQEESLKSPAALSTELKRTSSGKLRGRIRSVRDASK